MSPSAADAKATPGLGERVAQRRRIAYRDTLPTTALRPGAPLVSVIIATYNGERYLRPTLESVLAQTWQNLEVIVCDDGSTDATQKLLDGFRDRVLVHHQCNRGVAAARNRGAAFARGEFIAFLDQDDLWEPDMLERQAGLLVARTGYGLVYGDSWIIDENGRSRGQRKNFLEYHDGHVYSELLHGNFIPIETTVMPARVFRELGGFDERLRYLEDYELYLRVAREHPVAFQAHPVARYRIHADNLSRHKEALLREWVAVLDDLGAASREAPVEEQAILEGQRAKRCAEVAWQLARRGATGEARAWLRRAGSRTPTGMEFRVQAWCKVLETLPRPVAQVLTAWLPRKRLYGL